MNTRKMEEAGAGPKMTNMEDIVSTINMFEARFQNFPSIEIAVKNQEPSNRRKGQRRGFIGWRERSVEKAVKQASIRKFENDLEAESERQRLRSQELREVRESERERHRDRLALLEADDEQRLAELEEDYELEMELQREKRRDMERDKHFERMRQQVREKEITEDFESLMMGGKE